jgi:hypothetical protein
MAQGLPVDSRKTNVSPQDAAATELFEAPANTRELCAAFLDMNVRGGASDVDGTDRGDSDHEYW